ncbi:MAG: hypothetical protein EHM93_14405 [Bacteroidales bacterium]|nr:MAG: hypothetical protein EHM93_14405 [Bacteroidales bacterium]
MNRIKVTLTSLLFLYSLTIVKGQDIILKLDYNIKPTYCSDISVQNAKVTFKDFSDGKMHAYPLHEISQINLYENQPSEILVPRLQLDTIKCRVDSITRGNVYFRLGDNQSQVVSKDSVFCVLFNGLGYETADLYSDKYFRLNEVQYSYKPRIKRSDGTQIDVNNLISLTPERVEFELIKDGVKRVTFIDTKNVISYLNKKPIGKRIIIPSSDFILTSGGNLYETLITQVNEETVEYITNSRLSTITQKIEKNAIAGIFFFDYSAQKVIPSSNVEYTSMDGKNDFKKIRVDFNAGIGYLLADAPESSLEAEKKYIDDLRLGFTMDMNVNIFIIKELGFGIKFNQYKTSNSISNPSHLEDNIRIRFLGFSLLSQLELFNDRVFLNAGISFGNLSLVNHAKVNWDSNKIEGRTFGTYIVMGIDYFIEDYISVGIKVGRMTGKIDQLKLNNENIEMDEKEDLSRFDGVINFMIYF